MAKKKKYNPFKMWGSYVGATLGVPLVVLLIQIRESSSRLLVEIINAYKVEPMFLLISYTVIGFLTGYGIHALIRRLRK